MPTDVLDRLHTMLVTDPEGRLSGGRGRDVGARLRRERTGDPTGRDA
ncbi:hypothetical protein [Streptomyces synnematoformans]|uniref:Uncharacterized protein n=1 Tax=Streptomyces synnematoformans TaxID=415721 RepID=A0ABN2Z8U3_9ACTN